MDKCGKIPHTSFNDRTSIFKFKFILTRLHFQRKRETVLNTIETQFLLTVHKTSNERGSPPF